MVCGVGVVFFFEIGDVVFFERIVEVVRFWGISVSFGCVNSLISMLCCMSYVSIDVKIRVERQMFEDIICLCVGIEDVDDFIDDFICVVSCDF